MIRCFRPRGPGRRSIRWQKHGEDAPLAKDHLPVRPTPEIIWVPVALAPEPGSKVSRLVAVELDGGLRRADQVYRVAEVF